MRTSLESQSQLGLCLWAEEAVDKGLVEASRGSVGAGVKTGRHRETIALRRTIKLHCMLQCGQQQSFTYVRTVLYMYEYASLTVPSTVVMQ